MLSKQGQEYTEQYMIDYQRVDNGRWFRYRSRRGHEVCHMMPQKEGATVNEINSPLADRRSAPTPLHVTEHLLRGLLA